MRHLFLLATLAAAPLTGAFAQAARPLPATTDRYAFDAAQRACSRAHQHVAAAQLAHRPTTSSRNHERLMNRYDVGFVRIDIGLERTDNDVRPGSNVQTWARNASTTAPLDTLGFELNNGLTIDSLFVNGQLVAPQFWQRQTSGDVAIVLPTDIAPGAAFNYHVFYHGTPGPTGGSFFGTGLTSQADTQWGNRITWTLSSPFATSDWCPSKQVLVDKLDSVEVKVTTAADNKVGSNGVLQNVVTLPAGKVRYEWKTRYPIAYYLVSVTLGKFVDYTIYAHPSNMPTPGDSIPIVNYIYDNPQTLPSMKDEIDLTAPLLENYSEKVGLYPFWREKYGHCLAPISGGMEHQTMTTMLGFGFTLTAHELFHQWFGDNVTCRSYRDTWLNEGFATYGEYLSIEALAPPGITQQWLTGYRGQGLQNTGSVVVPATADTLDVGRVFSGSLTYAKGGLVVHALRHVINNDSAFFAALRAYQQQFSGRTATTRDLQHSLEASLGMQLGWFFDQWLYGQGIARTIVRWNQVGSNLLIESAQTSTASTVTPFFRMPLEFDYTPGVGQPAVTVRLEQTQPTQLWTIPLPSGVTATSIATDPRKWNLLRVTRTTRDNALGVTGLAAEVAAARFTVYPNPCTDFLTLPPATEARTAEVLDLAGRRISSVPLAAATDHLSTTALAPGSYLLRLTEGGTTRLTRFSKQ